MENFKTEKQKKQELIRILCVLLFFLAFYLIGLLYYTNHFLPHTIINGKDLSNLSLKQAEVLLNENAKAEMTIYETDMDGYKFYEKLDLTRLDSNTTYDPSYDLTIQNNLAWFAPPMTDTTCHKVKGEPDLNKIKELIDDLYCSQSKNTVETKDAQVVIVNGEARIDKEVYGTSIAADTLNNVITQAVSNYYEGSLNNAIDLSQFYEKPQLLSDDPSLPAKLETAQKFLNKKISIINADNTLTLENESLADLYTTLNSEVIADSEKVSNFVFTVSKENNHNVNRALNDLNDALKKSEDTEIQIQPAVTINGLADVSILEQMLYYYENDTLIMTSPVVTGNVDFGSEKPLGDFEVRRKKLGAYLMGAEYIEYVDYWMGWDPSGRVYGFHDAQWRDAFGGDIYLSDPSHGCVNLPTDKVAMLYEMADIGTKVTIRE